MLGASHAEVGAYVLDTWGLPRAIVESVAYHHAENGCLRYTPGGVDTVGAADLLAHWAAEAEPSGPQGAAGPPLTELDPDLAATWREFALQEARRLGHRRGGRP